MKDNYKSFMEQQQPSEQLLQDTISKALELDREEKKPQRVNLSGGNKKGWYYAIACVAVLCLVCVGVWNVTNGDLSIGDNKVVYTDLVNDFSPDENGDYQEKRQEEFGDERNLYFKNFDESYMYVFDKDAVTEEINVGEGVITVQIGTVALAGNQLLYQIEPVTLGKYEVFLGKIDEDGKTTLLAAFDVGENHYYIIGEQVTEEEMTDYIKGILKGLQ